MSDQLAVTLVELRLKFAVVEVTVVVVQFQTCILPPIVTPACQPDEHVGDVGARPGGVGGLTIVAPLTVTVEVEAAGRGF
jgi:hypothetical protein